jgi:hypothetical protein
MNKGANVSLLFLWVTGATSIASIFGLGPFLWSLRPLSWRQYIESGDGPGPLLRLFLGVPIGLVLSAIAGCQLEEGSASDPLCRPLRTFVASVDPHVTREVVFYTSWGSGFKGEEDAFLAKRCVHNGYAPARAVCDSLMQSGAVEFSGHNATRAVSCLSKQTRFAKGVQLDHGSFRFNYGTDNRGANVTVTYAEDESLGAMALHVAADGY